MFSDSAQYLFVLTLKDVIHCDVFSIARFTWPVLTEW